MRASFYDRWFCATGDAGDSHVRYDDISAFICNEENKKIKIFIKGSNEPLNYGFSSVEELNIAFDELKNHL